ARDVIVSQRRRSRGIAKPRRIRDIGRTRHARELEPVRLLVREVYCPFDARYALLAAELDEHRFCCRVLIVVLKYPELCRLGEKPLTGVPVSHVAGPRSTRIGNHSRSRWPGKPFGTSAESRDADGRVNLVRLGHALSSVGSRKLRRSESVGSFSVETVLFSDWIRASLYRTTWLAGSASGPMRRN